MLPVTWIKADSTCSIGFLLPQCIARRQEHDNERQTWMRTSNLCACLSFVILFPASCYIHFCNNNGLQTSPICHPCNYECHGELLTVCNVSWQWKISQIKLIGCYHLLWKRGVTKGFFINLFDIKNVDSQRGVTQACVFEWEVWPEELPFCYQVSTYTPLKKKKNIAHIWYTERHLIDTMQRNNISLLWQAAIYVVSAIMNCVNGHYIVCHTM